MKTAAALTCYACDEPATTKEHAPPFSFFPEGHRVNLITVPSCSLHNNLNSMDVEYTRNVISTLFGVNSVGERHFLDKGMRSFDHTPALFHKTFADIRPVRIKGVEVGAFTMEIDRAKAVMNACLSALRFRETGEKIPRWEVVLPNLGFSSNDVSHEGVIAWRQFLSLFSLVPFKPRLTSSPDVFQYEVGEIDGGRYI